MNARLATTRSLERVVARILRTGVAASTALILLGLALTFARHPDYRTSPEALQRLLSPEAPRSPAEVLAMLPQLRGQAFMLVGLILLIATPVVRVAAGSLLLMRGGERRLALFGLGVLALLVASYAVGHPGH